METHQPSLTDSAWLSTLLTQALLAHEEDRQAITDVLREDIGQAMTALSLYLRLAENTCNNPQCSTRLQEACASASDILQSIERLTHQLVPAALDNQGLGAALEVYAQDFTHTIGAQVELDLEVLPTRATSETELALFRTAQEALNNITNASEIRLTLRKVEDHLCLVIDDNGSGYSPKMLLSWDVLRMTQRAKILGVAVASRIFWGKVHELPLEYR